MTPFAPLTPEQERTVEEFHRLYFDDRGRTWCNTRWMGVVLEKCVMDLWVYQEIAHEVRPEVVIETGTANGGSALFWAHLCDILGRGRVITVDLEPTSRPGQPPRPTHPRITYVQGNSVARETVERVRAMVQPGEVVVLNLDSDHGRDHVLRELDAYADLVPPGSYVIVEDTDLNGHPVQPTFGPASWEAVHQWLPQHPEFEADRSREKYYVTWNPMGYLRRRDTPRA